MDFAIGEYIILLMCLWMCTNIHGSTKKGYGIDLEAFKCGDFDALTNINWWYNWDANLKKIQKKSGCTIDEKYAASFVPMIWGYNPTWEQEIYFVDDRYDVVQGFNEPNHKSQSNLAAQEAADAWHIVENAADNKKIVSPAAARCGSNCHSENYTVWFDEFFTSLCGNPSPCRVDYIATHIYSCKAGQTMRWIDQLYTKYKLPIWLTEFACPNSTYPEEQLHYMQSVLPLLEESDKVYKYAWFVHRRAIPDSFITVAANLFEVGSSQLTPLGQFYNDFQSTVTTTTKAPTVKPTTSPPSTNRPGTCRWRNRN